MKKQNQRRRFALRWRQAAACQAAGGYRGAFMRTVNQHLERKRAELAAAALEPIVPPADGAGDDALAETAQELVLPVAAGMRRRPVVGVMGSGSTPETELAEPLARLLARRGVNLLSGGGGGTMSSTCAAFAAVENRAGSIIAILPGVPAAGDGDWVAREQGGTFEPGPTMPPAGYPNQWAEIVIQTHLSTSGAAGTEISSRNHINILSSDAVVALPGGPGTLSEVQLAVAYGKPCIAFLGDGGNKTIGGEGAEGLGVPVATTLVEVDSFLQSCVALSGRLSI